MELCQGTTAWIHTSEPCILLDFGGFPIPEHMTSLLNLLQAAAGLRSQEGGQQPVMYLQWQHYANPYHIQSWNDSYVQDPV